MKAIRLILSVLLLPTLMLSSCDSTDDGGNTASLSLSSTNNIILSTKKADNSVEVLAGANYYIAVDYDIMTCALAVNDLQYASDKPAISFSIPQTRIAVSSSGWVIRLQDPFTVQASNGSTVTISDFDMEFTMRVGNTSALAMLEFTLDGKYQICTLLSTSNFVGTTSSTIIGDEENDPFSTTNSSYSVIVNRETAKAQVRIYKAQFASNMPTNLGTMVLDNIPVVFTSHGFAAAVTQVIPAIANASGTSDPYPQFTLTNVKIAYVAGMHLNMEFDCAAFNRHVDIQTRPY